MSSIPLPALHVQAPEQADPLQKLGQIGALKNQAIQGQLQQGELQQQQMQLKAQQDAERDQQAVQSTLAANGGDLNAALPKLAGQVSPKTFLALADANRKGMKDALDLSAAQRAEKTAQHDQLLGLIEQAKQLPPDQYQQAFPQIAASAVQIMPELQGKFDPSQPIPQEKLDGLALGIQTQTQFLAKADKEASIKKNTSQAAAADAAAANSQAELPGKQAQAQQQVKVNAGTSSTGITAEQQARLNFERQKASREQGNENKGTWSLQEDGKGGYVWTNNKTMEVRPISGGVQPKGTQAKTDAAYEKNVAAPKAAQTYANDYINNGVYTGAGDEALMEKFFELAKPSTGFRMSKPQQDMLLKARNWRNGAQAMFLHATKGTYFTDDQRKEIASTMGSLAAAKLAGQPQPSSGNNAPQGGNDPLGIR